MVMLEPLTKRYRLTGLLGEGGMARVFRAEDTLLGRPVAVKILRDQYAADPTFVQRFKQEARAVAGLTHPNVVNVYDVGEDAGRHFIVMEYVDGVNLKELIRRDGPLPPAQVVDLGVQICAGVQAAHGRQIVHRDVKPQNLLLTRDGRVKIADFGIAQALSAATASETGQVLGSVHYLSPEQARGHKVSAASDLYQIGVVLYELLTGRVPFEAETPVGVALKHIQEAPTPPHVANPKVPPTLSNIVVRALAKDPADRYAGVGDLAVELQGYADFIAGKTSAYRVAPADSAPDAGTRGRGDTATRGPGGTGPAVVAPRSRVAPPARRPARRGVDWLLVGLGTLALVAVLGLLVLGAVLYYTFGNQGSLPIDPGIAGRIRQLTGVSQPAPAPKAASAGKPAAAPTAAPTPAPRIAVPSVVGLDPTAARERLRSQDLAYREGGEAYHDSVPAGRLIRQSPESGQPVEPGTAVEVLVSLGRKPVPVPPVVGSRYEDAAARLRAAGFGIARDDAWNPTVAAGTVAQQAPVASTELAPGKTVTLTVSRGPEKVQVPNVVGKPEGDAKKLIEQARLKNYAFVNFQGHNVLPDDILKQVCVGCVLSTTPAAGEWIDPGAEVYMAVRRD